MSKIFAIVLAAGRGKRMRSRIPKVAHKLQKKTLLQWTLDSLINANINNIMVVISHNKIIKDILQTFYSDKNVKLCYQRRPLGTADAVYRGMSALAERVMSSVKPWDEHQNSEDSLESVHEHKVSIDTQESDVLIAYGDTPAVRSITYKSLVQFHRQEHNAITIIAFYAKDPFGYGRVVLNNRHEFLAIREEKDCSSQEKLIHLCHSGLMCANFKVLNDLLPQVQNKNAASEFYLTDVIRIAKSLGHKVGFIASDREDEFSGVNTPEQLAVLEKSLCVE